MFRRRPPHPASSAEVVALSRRGTALPGARSVAVDVGDEAALAEALAGVEAPSSEGVPLDGILRGADAPSAQRTLFGQSLPYDLTGGQWRFVARDARAQAKEAAQAG